MTPESLGHDLTARDPADAPRCPMEALADRINTKSSPSWLKRWGFRYTDGSGYFELSFNLDSVEQLDDLIAFLQEVRG